VRTALEISINNVHLDLGAGRRGTDMGPSAMHVAGLREAIERLGHKVAEVGSVRVQSLETIETPGDPRNRYLGPVSRTCAQLARRVETAIRAGRFPLTLGGDHSGAIGAVGGLVKAHQGGRVGVLWVDAHADINTPASSPSGNIHGMPLAVLLGHGLPELVAIGGEGASIRPEDVVILGARDVDPGEREMIARLGVRAISMSEIDARGLVTCLDEALAIVQHDTIGFHLSFDLDAVDPLFAPGVGTPVPGGLSVRESHLICEQAANTGKLLSLEVVELNPTLDLANQTGRLAVWLIQSALGKRIL